MPDAVEFTSGFGSVGIKSRKAAVNGQGLALEVGTQFRGSASAMRPDEAAAHLGLSSTEIETLQRVVRDQPSRVAAFMLSYLEEECSEGRDRRVVIAQVAYLCIALHIPPGLLCETLDQAEASTAMALRQLYRDA
jgi:hypothetical protein